MSLLLVIYSISRLLDNPEKIFLCIHFSYPAVPKVLSIEIGNRNHSVTLISPETSLDELTFDLIS